MARRTCKRKRGVKPEPPAVTPGSIFDLPASEPFVPFSIADGELKYVRFEDGQLILVNPRSCLSHERAAVKARTRSVIEESTLKGCDAVKSAGRVVIDREARTVVMAERDSHSLKVKSLDEDAEFIRVVLFGSKEEK